MGWKELWANGGVLDKGGVARPVDEGSGQRVTPCCSSTLMALGWRRWSCRRKVEMWVEATSSAVQEALIHPPVISTTTLWRNVYTYINSTDIYIHLTILLYVCIIHVHIYVVRINILSRFIFTRSSILFFYFFFLSSRQRRKRGENTFFYFCAVIL